MPAAPLQIPTLTTHRLSMEPISFSYSYSQDMFELWSDAEVCKFSGAVKDYDGNTIAMPAATLADSDSIIDFWLRAADDGWGCRWAVRLAGTQDAFAGISGGAAVEIRKSKRLSKWKTHNQSLLLVDWECRVSGPFPMELSDIECLFRVDCRRIGTAQ